MTIGVGGSDAAAELAKLDTMTADVRPIKLSEYQARIAKACRLMADKGLDAVYLNAGTNLLYFTGTKWWPSERMVGAVLFADGTLIYIAPDFEISTLKSFTLIEGDIRGWQEHESPYHLFAAIIGEHSKAAVRIGLDETTPFFISNGIRLAAPAHDYVDAKPITAGCRAQKSAAELALMQRAKDMTLRVQQAAARILKPGISTSEVTAFINQAHQRVGAAGSSFCIVLFGEATAYPHGVKDPQILKDGDMVLIDTGCVVEGYNSDITRTYVYGEPTERQREVWAHEKAAQLAAFDAAVLGKPCGSVDAATRRYLESVGYGPDYAVPGLPHRTGHGVGLDIHEWPYLVRGDETPLAAGMCFSNEPMICLYGDFGVRLEDHFFMTETGPKWFTEPCRSIDDPFGYGSWRPCVGCFDCCIEFCGKAALFTRPIA